MSGVKCGGYVVTKIADKCAENCFGPTCTKAECGQLCMHMYTCNKACYDFNNGHICKHIHRVHSITQSQIITTTEHTAIQTFREEMPLENNFELDLLEYAESIIPPQEGTMGAYEPPKPTCKLLVL